MRGRGGKCLVATSMVLALMALAAGCQSSGGAQAASTQSVAPAGGPAGSAAGLQTATLIVHTAGTRNSIVTVPGLAPDRAAEIRDIIREHIRTDFA